MSAISDAAAPADEQLLAPAANEAQAAEVPTIAPAAAAARAPVPAEAIPAAGVIYKVNSCRCSFGELWRDTRSASVLTVWLSKLLRVRLPGAVNDPNVESLRPFVVKLNTLPNDIRARLLPRVRELGSQGFDLHCAIVFHIKDLFNRNEHYMVALARADGKAVARVNLRIEAGVAKGKVHSHCDILTELNDGDFVWTNGARALLDHPPSIRVQSQVNGTPSQLWREHLAALGQGSVASRIRLAKGGKGMLELLERHHVAVRDFHLQRGLFVPMSDLEQTNAEALRETYTQSLVRGSASPEIMAEIERLQANKNGWMSGLLILVISLGLFITLGLRGSSGHAETSSLELLALMVPILFFHELGHYLAMRVFRYRNVRMFFIPGFGAAVSGQGYEAPAWKKVIVSLMGPLPGIGAAAVLGVVGIGLHYPLMVKAAMLAVILNGFNLLPVLPLDGGRVVQYLLFSRHWGLDVAFRIVAALALVAGGTFTSDRFLMYLGILMVISIPQSIKIGQIASQLRREGLAPTPTGDHRISPQVADVIVERVRGAFTTKKGKLNHRIAARHTLNVYEALCAKPPGLAASLGFGAVHLGGFFLAVVLALVFAIASGGSLASMLRRAAQQPTYTFAPGDSAIVDRKSELASAVAPTTAPVAADNEATRTTVLAQFFLHTSAERAFNDLSPQVKPGQTLERFGETVLVSMPMQADADRHDWLEKLNSKTSLVTVQTPRSYNAALRLQWTAPSAAAAEAVRQELQDYLGVPHNLRLVPPWDAQRISPQRWQQAQIARRTYARLQSLAVECYQDPRMKDLSKRVEAAGNDGDQVQLEELTKQQQALLPKVCAERLAALHASDDPTVDRVVVEQYAKLPNPFASAADDDDEPAPKIDYTAQPYQVMAQRMCQLGADTAADERNLSATSGFVHVDGTKLTVNFLRFAEPTYAAPALMNWLEEKGAGTIRYDFDITARSRSSP